MCDKKVNFAVSLNPTRVDYLQESLWESKEITQNYTGIIRNHTGINRNHLNHAKLLESYR